MKNRFNKILAAFVLITAGIGLMAYPFLANYLFENRQLSIISTYEAKTDGIKKEEIEKALEEAKNYNNLLLHSSVLLYDPFTEEIDGYEEADYNRMLTLDGTDVMGYISIPCIDISLPVYHGTSEEVLETGIGHLEGSSLPVGGESTHAVLTGHTGLSSAKLFTDLMLLEEGDIFIITVLGEKLAYEIDQIKVVEPENISDLMIVNGMDYVTLLTCTPYGINTHRLLVRGHRTEYSETLENTAAVNGKTANSEWMRQYSQSVSISAGLIIAAFLIIIMPKKRRNH